MTYDKTKFKLQRVSGMSTLDAGMRLDETTLDEPIGAYETVTLSSFNVTVGYTIGANKEQSIDPSSASASRTEYVSGPNNGDAFLAKQDYVEATYDEILIAGFTGIVTNVTVVQTPEEAYRRGEQRERTTSYTFASLESLLLNNVASWNSLPEETAYSRLSRWFDIDISGVAHTDQLAILVPAEDAGSASLLELARAFSAATMISLRLAPFDGPTVIQAFDDTMPWPDQPLVATTGFEDAAPWTNEVEYTNGIPTSLSVTENDTRLLGGITTVGVEQNELDEDFYLDHSRMDVTTSLDVGFRAPQPIDVFGFVLPVLKLTQTFGDTYAASIELDPANTSSSVDAVVTLPPTPLPTELVDDVVDIPGNNLPNGEGAYVFDGMSDFLEALDNNAFSISNTGGLSIEAWVRPDTLEFPNDESSGYVHWMAKGLTGQQEWVLRMYSLTNDEDRPNRISAYAFNLAGGLGAGSYVQEPVSVGEWIHITATYSVANNRIRIYKNGVLKDEDGMNVDPYFIVPGNGSAPLRIGTRDGLSLFKGAVAKVAIYSRELTAAEILRHTTVMTMGDVTYDSIVLTDTPTSYWPLHDDFVDVVNARNLDRIRLLYSSSENDILITANSNGVNMYDGTTTLMRLRGDALIFSNDTILYRGSASHLRTDDKFTSNIGLSSTSQIAAANSTAGHTVYYGETADTSGNLIRGRVNGDSADRVWITGSGGIGWSDGAGGGNATLYRSTAGGGGVVLRTDTPFRLPWYTTGARPAANSVGIGTMIYDQTLAKPIWSSGTQWRDAAGTVV